MSNQDPFDPASLRLSQDFAATAGVKKLLNRVPVRKPTRQEFVQVHPDALYHLSTLVLELKEDRDIYLVAPSMRDDLLSEAFPVTLFTTINRQRVLTLWPCRLPGPEGRSNPWHQSALEAAAYATKAWVRVEADMSLGAYGLYEAAGELPAPEWPDMTLAEILKIAFRDKYIDNPDHPVVQRLRGRT
jgi:hypothetical protein